ncbi:MAG: hypothetical protein IKX37_04920 [Bacteroidales bacterium]|nr:hypothetical protein [Bacteroidales bacterium]
MKRLILFVAAAFACAALQAQTTQAEYLSRYNRLTEKGGVNGLGVETLISKWEKDYPDDPDMLEAKFLLYSTQSMSAQVIQLSQDRYLGRDPLIPYTDSLGVKRNYFEDTLFDETLFAQASKALTRAIAIRPDRLDYRCARINYLISYEKESPDMALVELKDLIDMTYSGSQAWHFPGVEGEVDKETFKAFMQDYCFTFFKIASPSSYEAFRQVSERMLKYEPGDPVFLDNLGSYWLVFKKDGKKALSYYNKVLKKHPDDLTALRNCVVLARHEKNLKLEKKYLPLLIKYTDNDTERASSEARLNAMNTK